MTTLREAAQMALKVLEAHNQHYAQEDTWFWSEDESPPEQTCECAHGLDFDTAIAALKVALDEPTSDYRAMYLKVRDELAALQQRPEAEPVAWMLPEVSENGIKYDSMFRDNHGGVTPETRLAQGFVPLYTAPPLRTPLPEEEILKISDKIERSDFFEIVIPFARAIEAAHGIVKEET